MNSYGKHAGPGRRARRDRGTFDRQFGNYASTGCWVWAGSTTSMRCSRHATSTSWRSRIRDGLIFNAPSIQIPSVTYFDLTIGYELPNEDAHPGGHAESDGQGAAGLFYQNNVLNANTDVSTYDTLGRQYWRV